MCPSNVTLSAELGANVDAPIMEARGLGKRYPGVVALDDVSLSLRAGRFTPFSEKTGLENQP